jgi:hypothetical protein
MSDSAQPYELRFEERPGYFYAYAKAEQLTEEIALAYVREIVDEAARLDQTRLMIERDIPMMLPAGTLFFTTKEFTIMIEGMRVVFVNPYPELDDDMDFAITIATNRGADYTVVRNVEAAEKWLLG